ncbi:hypothetical protein [Streptomyces sp. NPDC096311]|uniref:hypothetical protein n=1 Tax=Streptomyces sp. NPDC096311 TaxID=3366083 RepID=UPI0038023A8E
MPGCGVQLGAAGQDVPQGDALLLAQDRGMAGENGRHRRSNRSNHWDHSNHQGLRTYVVTASGGRLGSPEMPGEEIGGAS